MTLDLSKIVLDQSRKLNKFGKNYNIIDYFESPWGLNRSLYPVQRVILKAAEGIPLDKIRKTVQVRTFRGELLNTLTEEDYLKYLHDEGRSNIRVVTPGLKKHKVILCIGRRGGKSMMAGGLMTFGLDNLLKIYDPQSYYKMAESARIELIAVATDKDQSGILYNEILGHFQICDIFKPFIANTTQSFTRFQTQKDVEKFKSYLDDPTAKCSIRVTFKVNKAAGLRGQANYFIVLDEFAFFPKTGEGCAKDVYDSVTPSQATFTKKINETEQGPIESRIVIISSPNGKDGHFYQLFENGFSSDEVDKTLCIRAPSWEVNPTLSSDFLISKYNEDPKTFFVEFGSEFSSSTLSWVEQSDIDAVIIKDRKPTTQGVHGKQYFVGLDIAFVNDACAIAIGHIEDNNIVLDLVDTIQAGKGRFENVRRLELDEIIEWVNSYYRKFLIKEGCFDDHAGIPFEQGLQKKGIKNILMQKSTQDLNSKIFKNFKDMIYTKKIELYNYPVSEKEKYCDYIKELLELQETRISKNITTVEAPNIRGKHDDMADAISRMVWLASQNFRQQTIISGAANANREHAREAIMQDLQQRRRNLRGIGSDISRTSRRKGWF